MSEVMQERRDDELLARAVLFRKQPRLQRMLELSDRFAAIGNAAVRFVKLADILDTQCHAVFPIMPGWMGSTPGQGKRLQVRKAFHRFLHAFLVPEPRIL